MEEAVQINSIFQSISGEVGTIPQGAITWFIRTQGCSLGCSWCDTKYAQDNEAGDRFGPGEIAYQIPSMSNVVITGGEPLEQRAVELSDLVARLITRGCRIQIETNGACIPYLPVCHVFDYKTPSSGVHNQMIDNHQFLVAPHYESWIKFVIKNTEDLAFSVDKILNFEKDNGMIHWALSVADGKMASQAMRYIDVYCPWLSPQITFNFQLHKKFELP
jgi:7-carboxy-7-deazaguanine synthase